MLLRFISVMSLTILLAGCVTPAGALRKSMDESVGSYIGQPLENFLIKMSPPKSIKTSGSMSYYQWSADAESKEWRTYNLESGAAFQVKKKWHCELNIISQNGFIIDGNWSGSPIMTCQGLQIKLESIRSPHS